MSEIIEDKGRASAHSFTSMKHLSHALYTGDNQSTTLRVGSGPRSTVPKAHPPGPSKETVHFVRLEAGISAGIKRAGILRLGLAGQLPVAAGQLILV